MLANIKKQLALFFLACFLQIFFLKEVIADDRLYYADLYNGSSNSLNINTGSGIELYSGALGILDRIVVVGNNIYFTNAAQGTISRADIDGSNIQTVVSGMPFNELVDLSYHAGTQKLIWSYSSGDILSANTDGTAQSVIMSAPDSSPLFGINAAGDLFFSSFDGTTNNLYRTNVIGTIGPNLVGDISAFGVVPISVGVATLYFGAPGSIVTTDFSLGSAAMPLNGFFLPNSGMALDETADRICFSTFVGGLYCGTIDGSDILTQVLPNSGSSIGGVAFNANKDRLFFTRIGSLAAVNPDGTGYQNLPAVSSSWMVSPVLDSLTRWLYWVDFSNASIVRSNTLGENPITVRSRSDLGGEPGSIAIDTTNRYLYVTVGGFEIKRVSLDTFAVESLQTSQFLIRKLEVDNTGGYYYWNYYDIGTDAGTLARASLSSPLTAQAIRQYTGSFINSFSLASNGFAYFSANGNINKCNPASCAASTQVVGSLSGLPNDIFDMTTTADNIFLGRVGSTSITSGQIIRANIAGTTTETFRSSIGFPLGLKVVNGLFSVEGSVVDENGDPVSGASLRLQFPSSSVNFTTTSNSDGSFTFSYVPNGSGWDLITSKSGLTFPVQEVDISGANRTALSVVSDPLPKPDLSVSITKTRRRGRVLKTTINVSNTGTAASTNTELYFYISKAASDPNRRLALSVLAPGVSVAGSFTYQGRIPLLSREAHSKWHVSVVASPTDAVGDEDTSNNTAVRRY